MSIAEWRDLATEALNLGSDSDEGQALAARLVNEFNFDMAYGGPLARLDDWGVPLEEEEVNLVCRMFGYSEIAGE